VPMMGDVRRMVYGTGARMGLGISPTHRTITTSFDNVLDSER